MPKWARCLDRHATEPDAGREARRPPPAVRRRPRRRVRPGQGPRRLRSATTTSPAPAASPGRSPTPAILCVTAYGFGLPDVPRTRRGRASARPSAPPSSAAAAISLLQLFVGDALLPRFVVFGSAAAPARLVPALRPASPPAAGSGPRPATASSWSAAPDEVAALELELHGPARAPGRRSWPASRVEEAAVPHRRRTPPARGAAPRAPAHGARARPGRPGRRRASSPRPPSSTSGACASARSPLFYEEWLGKLPVSELERASLLFDIGELHRAGYGRAKRLVDVPARAASARVVLAVVAPGRVGRQPRRQPRPAALPPGRGSARAAAASRILKFRTMRAAPAARPVERVDRARTTRGSRRFGRVLRGHATSTSCPQVAQHPPRRPRRRRAPARSSPTTSRS